MELHPTTDFSETNFFFFLQIWLNIMLKNNTGAANIQTRTVERCISIF
jgi:hypothetical protein